MKKIIDLTKCSVTRKIIAKGCLFLLSTSPATGYCVSTITLSSENPVAIRQVNIDIDELAAKWERAAPPWAQVGQHLVALGSKEHGWSYFSCKTNWSRNITGSYESLFNDPNIRRQYLEKVVEDIRSCSPWVLEGSNPPPNAEEVKTWVMSYTDGWYDRATGYRSGINLPYLPFNTGTTPPPSTDCLAHKLIDFNFGTVPQKITSSPPSARGSIFLRCSKPTGVTIEINGGEDLVNRDHSRIHFEYPQYVELEGEIPISVKPYAEMISPPAKPGSYLWSIPVVITFD